MAPTRARARLAADALQHLFRGRPVVGLGVTRAS